MFFVFAAFKKTRSSKASCWKIHEIDWQIIVELFARTIKLSFTKGRKKTFPNFDWPEIFIVNSLENWLDWFTALSRPSFAVFKCLQ